jgi:hypothetical protein
MGEVEFSLFFNRMDCANNLLISRCALWRFLAGTVLWEFRLGVECALFDDGLGGQGRVVAGFGWIRSDLVGLTWTGVMKGWSNGVLD